MARDLRDNDLLLFPDAPNGDAFLMPAEEQLSVDVLETDKEVVLKTAIAGVRPEDVEVFVNGDMLTVRGTRKEQHSEEGASYLVRECRWGSFSRSVILPTDVDADRIEADMKHGMLTVRMPKLHRSKRIEVRKR